MLPVPSHSTAKPSFPSYVLQWRTCMRKSSRIGVTFVEIELGQAPFQHSSEMGILQHIMHTCGGSLAVGESMTKQNAGSHPWGQRYGPRFQDLIDAMLVVEPARRTSADSCARCSSLMSHSQAPDSKGHSHWQGPTSRWQGP